MIEITPPPIAMTPYTVYETATGKIKRFGQCTQSAFARLAKAGESAIRSRATNDVTQCVIDGALANKLPMTGTLTGATISGLPTPCTVIIEHVQYQLTDGVAELSFTLPGTYDVLCESPRYLQKTFQVTI